MKVGKCWNRKIIKLIKNTTGDYTVQRIWLSKVNWFIQILVHTARYTGPWIPLLKYIPVYNMKTWPIIDRKKYVASMECKFIISLIFCNVPTRKHRFGQLLVSFFLFVFILFTGIKGVNSIWSLLPVEVFYLFSGSAIYLERLMVGAI